MCLLTNVYAECLLIIGCVCLSCRYACYLVFQLRTHHDLFCGEDEDEEPVMTFPGAIAVLTGITVAVAVCSEYVPTAAERSQYAGASAQDTYSSLCISIIALLIVIGITVAVAVCSE